MSSGNERRNQRETDEKADRDSTASQASGRRQSRAASKRDSQETKSRTAKATDESPQEEHAAGADEEQARNNSAPVDGSDDGRSTQAGRRPVEYGEMFNPSAAIRVERLRLARRWRDAGLVYSAIYAYTQVLERYPCTGAARAAAEELLDLAKELADEDKYYTALNIFNRLEELA